MIWRVISNNIDETLTFMDIDYDHLTFEQITNYKEPSKTNFHLLITLKRYITIILKQINPSARLSASANLYINYLLECTIKSLLHHCLTFLETICSTNFTSNIVIFAVNEIFIGNLIKHAKSEITKTITQYAINQ